MMKYGRFSPDNTEFIVSRLDTPRPWYNRFGNSEHGVVISHTAGGYAVAGGDKRRFQLNWYIPRYDESGRYLYIRDDQSRQLWSASWAPVRADLDRYECRHGLAWSTFSSEKNGIACDYTVFVPVNGPVEIWRVTLTNRSKRPRRLTLVPFVEWSLDDSPQSVDDLVYAAHTDADYDPSTLSIVASRRDPARYCYDRAFLTADFRPSGWDANRAAFVGPARTLANPHAVQTGRLSGTPAEAEVAVGALAHSIRLAPGQSAAFHVMLGMAQTRADRAALRRRFLAPARPEAEWQRLRKFWADMSRRFEIHTPDRALDGFVNRWLAAHVYKQGVSTAVRAIRVQHRNQMQDAMGLAWLAPEHCRRLIFRLMRFHCASGDALQWWSLGAPWTQGPEHVDTKLWIIYTTRAYLQETGDFAALRHREPLFDTSEKAALLDVMYRAVDKCWRDRGRHGLCLIGRGDWNDNLDGMGRKGKGESVWMSMALHLALLHMIDLAGFLGHRKRAALLRARAKALRDAINRWGWDGQWYIMGYTDNGRPIGTHKAKQGRLFLMPQAWAILSGVATPDRARKLFHTIDTRLETPFGARLNEECFTIPDPSIGRVTFLAKGLNENGPIYVHSNAFKLCADGLAGRGDALHAGLRKQFPCFHDPAVTLCEPFVLPNYYRPPDIPRKYGATVRSWVTTAPSWFLAAVIEGLFGVRVTYRGIEFSPSIPRKWKRASIRRLIRGATYDVTILNPSARGRAVRQITLDGRPLPGNTLPFQRPGTTHKVQITLGP